MNIRQINMKGLIRNVGEKEATRLLKQIMENNVMLLNLHRKILELQVAKDQKRRRQQEREQRGRENKERWEEKEERRKKERE